MQGVSSHTRGKGDYVDKGRLKSAPYAQYIQLLAKDRRFLFQSYENPDLLWVSVDARHAHTAVRPPSTASLAP